MNLQSLIPSIKSNWKSGLAVSLVSIPLSISLAIASGVSPIQGIITGIWAGLIASFFGGSNFNIVGPTGALSGIIASHAIIHGAQSVSMVALCAGIFILIAYALKWERFIVFIPSSVIHGFTLGIALIIALNQLNFALGLEGLVKHEKFIDNVLETVRNICHFCPPTLLIFSFFLSALFVLRHLINIPGAIILSPLGILLGYATTYNIISLPLKTIQSTFGIINATLFIAPTFSLSKASIITALVVALVAILETMLSAKIADGITHTRHNSHKEMFGLGLANIASGLMGGMPATAALARTALNIKTGATNSMSATLSSIFMICISLLVFSWFKFMPMAVIAAILVYVAINMIERKHFDRLFKYDKTTFFITLLVAGITVYEDPIMGILIGTALSLLLFVENLAKGHYEIAMPEDEEDTAAAQALLPLKTNNVLIYSIKGKLIYINSIAHINRFENDFDSYTVIILRLRDIYFIDLDGIDALDEIIDIIQTKKQKVLIASVNPSIKNSLIKTSKTFEKLEKEGLVFNKTTDALRYANQL
ncbi:MAG: solute carrier family 23 protein [Candidatus Babeliales bacterium]|nr:solute carrier family 23 protein [Candidatus Babeliales bacterium]